MMKKMFTVFAAVLMLGLMLSACGSKKEAISLSDFTSKATAAGLSLQDASADFEGDIFTDAQYAVSPEGWKVAFITVDTVENAQAYWTNCKDFMISKKTGAGSAQTTDHDDYKMYSQTNGGRFMYVSQIGTTMVYVNEDESAKSSVQSFIKSINY